MGNLQVIIKFSISSTPRDLSYRCWRIPSPVLSFFADRYPCQSFVRSLTRSAFLIIGAMLKSDNTVDFAIDRVTPMPQDFQSQHLPHHRVHLHSLFSLLRQNLHPSRSRGNNL